MKHGILLVLIFLSSCVDFIKSDQLEKIEALSLKLLEAQDLNVALIDSAQFYLEKIVHLDSTLKYTCQDDTLNFESAKNIDLFLNIKRSFLESHSVMKSIDSLISLKKKSIRYLGKDIKNSTGYRSKYGEFILFEGEEIFKVENQLKDNRLQLIELMKTFNILFPKLNDYIESP